MLHTITKQKRIKTTMLLVLAVLAMVSLSGCKSKEPISVSQFEEILEQNGFEIADVSDEYADWSGIVEVAGAQKGDVRMDFGELDTNDHATALYNQMQANVESFEGGANSNLTVNLINHQKYELTTGERYYVVVRVNNTFLASSIDKAGKAELKNIIKELGY